jgi:Domain of Unknown Function (DUF748)
MKKGFRTALIAGGVTILVLIVSIALLIKNANRIIKHELESFLGEDFSARRIDLYWGKVEALNISFKNPAGKEVFKTDRLILEADFIGLLKKEYILSNLSFENPYLFLEKDTKGEIVTPFPKKGSKKEEEKPMPPIFFKKIQVTNASLDYLDRSASSRPVLIKLRNVEFEFKDLTFPLGDNFSTYNLSASIPGRHHAGSLRSNGKIKLANKDMDGKVKIKKLDIADFKPYYQKRGDVNVTRGIVDMNMDVKIRSNKINSPGKAVLKDLEFERGSGIGNTFLNMPLSAVVCFLKNNNDEIVVNFVVQGDLNNPKFNLRESFMNRISIAIAEKLGLSIQRIGESIVETGAEGAKQVGKGAKSIGETIKKFLER